jgi:hypothetical protein
MMRLFSAYGCEKPSVSNLNVKTNGYELDIRAKFSLTKEQAIAECKAWSTRLPSETLSAFYGKLATERLDNNDIHGWFVSIPGLTSDGTQLAKRLEKGDKRFRVIEAQEIYDRALENGWVKSMPPETGRLADHALLVTEVGYFPLAKVLNEDTRLPASVIIGPQDGQVPDWLKDLVAETDYAASLPVELTGPLGQDEGPPESRRAPRQPIVSVAGSSDDFEYQLPASPRFFVGRKEILHEVKEQLKTIPDAGKVVVLNAQSGWGKSSLALRIGDVARRLRGHASIYDTRTASTPEYVWSALRAAIIDAAGKGVLSAPDDVNFGSLEESLQTLSACRWRRSGAPLVIFFDQFENVFREERLTREFRDLALAIRDVERPVLLGFSWKTDLVGWTERYPYRLRDDIRGAAAVIVVPPFGARDVSTLLSRLSKAAEGKLSDDLRQRLREYSQGLPWLLKKLANHILGQLKAGVSEEALIEESLNVQRLFEEDLAKLEAREVDAVRQIAADAPIAVDEILERIPAAVVQSLVDQRLLVRVGQSLDVYWDIFREFLITGKVAIEDSFILRTRPTSTSALLRLVVESGDAVSSSAAAGALDTSQHVVFNYARELRQVGILAPRSGGMALVEALKSGSLTEQMLRDRVARTLRRHRVYRKVGDMIRDSGGNAVTIDDLAEVLPTLFPAVQAKRKIWRIYAIAFAAWFGYAGLFQVVGKYLRLGVGNPEISLLSGTGGGRQRTFPSTRPRAAARILENLRQGMSPEVGLSASQYTKGRADLLALGLLTSEDTATDVSVLEGGKFNKDALRKYLIRVPGGDEAIKLLEHNPVAEPAEIGRILSRGYGTEWRETTGGKMGACFRTWAEAAGIEVKRIPRRKLADPI